MIIIAFGSLAFILSRIIEKNGPYDMIFCGRHASDFDYASVPFAISEFLSIPIINIVKSITLKDEKLLIERVITDGFQMIEASMPLIITTGNQVGDPRYPTLKGIMNASKKQINNLSLSDLGISETEILPLIELEEMFFPENENKVEMIEGANNQEKAVNLISKLKEEGAI
mgnify:CR=1 FL=1